MGGATPSPAQSLTLDEAQRLFYSGRYDAAAAAALAVRAADPVNLAASELPRGTRWLLGGGNKKHGLLVVREAAETEADFFVQAEAGFALWDMQVRERNLIEAVATARARARDFPDNQELTRFIERHDPTAQR